MKSIEEFAMNPTELGFRISVVKNPWEKCPFCFTTKSTMAVYEHGVQWGCGCARRLPKLHPTSNRDCPRCEAIQDGVVPFRPYIKIACIDRRAKQKLSA